MNQVILYFDTRIKVLCHKEYSTLLVALEAHKIKVEYQCREGYCGSCRCRLVSGQVDWLIEPLAFVSEEEILLCCCRAVGDIKLKIQ